MSVVVKRDTRLPVRLSVEVEKPNGRTYTFHPDAKESKDRPSVQAQFGSQRGTGFSDGSFTLRRSITRDFPDLGLGDTVRFLGADSSIAYEGYVTALPRSTDGGQSVTVTCAGWMGHAQDERLREIYVDRDLSRWGGPSAQRQADLLALTPRNHTTEGNFAVQPDASGSPRLNLNITRVVATAADRSFAEAWCRGDIPIGEIVCDYSDQAAGAALVADWDVRMAVCDDDVATNSTISADYAGTAEGKSLIAPDGTETHVRATMSFGGTFTGDLDVNAWFRHLTIYGRGGLTKRGTAPDQGFYVSDLIRDMASRWAPKLDTSGVQDTSYVVRQAAYHEPVFPFDAWQDLNKFHLCFPGDTPIICGDGRIKRAEEIEAGDLVVTHNGNLTAVKAVASRPNAKPMVAVTPWLGESILLTPEHEVFTQRGWVEAKDLELSDQVTMPVRPIFEDGRTELPTFKVQRVGQTGGRQPKGAGIPIPLDRETGFAIGYYLAEGCPIKKDSSPQGIVFARDLGEIAYADRACAALEPWVTSRNTNQQREGSRTATDTIYGAAVARAIVDHFGTGADKRVPDWAFRSGEEFCRGLLLGYLSGDGSKVYGKKAEDYDCPTVVACSIRSSLVTQLRDVAAALGYGWGSLRFREGGERAGRRTQDAWTVGWNGDAARRLRRDLGLPPSSTRGQPRSQKYEIRDGRVWIRLRKLEMVEPTAEVWDLEVEHDDHSFRTPHFAISNCELAVWENRVLHYHPPTSLDDWDWEVRLGDPGVRVALEGDQLPYNGVDVSFTDLLSGQSKTIGPNEYAELYDASDANPTTAHGRRRFYPTSVPFPCVEADAVQVGRARLSEVTRATAAGRISTGPYIRNRQGTEVPAWRVRGGQRVIISNHPNDRPRRVRDARWSGRGAELATDNSSKRLEAYFDRVQSARSIVLGS